MKAQLKEAMKAERDAQSAAKVAASLEATGQPEYAMGFHVEASLADEAAHQLMAAVPPTCVRAGEVVPTEAERPDANGGWALRDTLASPDVAALAASMERTELLTHGYTDVLALGIDAAQSIGGHNSLEKMLAHQMALAHKTAFRLTEEALQQRDPDHMARLINASARMMSVYQQAMLTLHRIRTGGTQTVTVQHVNITGGQAVVAGSMQTGGLPARGAGVSNEKRE